MTQGHLQLATAEGCSPGLQSGEARFQTRLNAPVEIRGLSPGVRVLLNADGISRLYENRVLYQGTTLVVPNSLRKSWALAPEVRFLSALP